MQQKAELDVFIEVRFLLNNSVDMYMMYVAPFQKKNEHR
jgi:hypothetical protein